MELIPTGEIIRVVHPYRPCKLVSWGAEGGRKGGSVSPGPAALFPANPWEEVSSGKGFQSLWNRRRLDKRGNGEEGERF